jgi:hypothetical protein
MDETAVARSSPATSTSDSSEDPEYARYKRYREKLKTWEMRFEAKHNRKPTKQDIDQHPQVADKYKQYARLKAKFKNYIPNSSNGGISQSGSRVGDDVGGGSGGSRGGVSRHTGLPFVSPRSHAAFKSRTPSKLRTYITEEAFLASIQQPNKENKAGPGTPSKRSSASETVGLNSTKKSGGATPTSSSKKKKALQFNSPSNSSNLQRTPSKSTPRLLDFKSPLKKFTPTQQPIVDDLTSQFQSGTSSTASARQNQTKDDDDDEDGKVGGLFGFGLRIPSAFRTTSPTTDNKASVNRRKLSSDSFVPDFDLGSIAPVQNPNPFHKGLNKKPEEAQSNESMMDEEEAVSSLSEMQQLRKDIGRSFRRTSLIGPKSAAASNTGGGTEHPIFGGLKIKGRTPSFLENIAAGAKANVQPSNVVADSLPIDS